MRLALDVHDGPMQNLAVIGFSLGDLRRRLQLTLEEGDHAQIDAGMEQLGADLGRVESDLRALITALEDGGVTSLPLVDAIEYEIVEFERRSAAKVEFHAIGEVRVETDSQRIALQSVTREALANVAKHAAAHNVWITLSGTEDAVSLEIEDDGRGFRVGAQVEERPHRPGRHAKPDRDARRRVPREEPPRRPDEHHRHAAGVASARSRLSRRRRGP